MISYQEDRMKLIVSDCPCSSLMVFTIHLVSHLACLPVLEFSSACTKLTWPLIWA